MPSGVFLFTVRFSKRSTTLKKKNQRKMANFSLTVNVLHYFIDTYNPRWILTLQERQLAKKAPDA